MQRVCIYGYLDAGCPARNLGNCLQTVKGQSRKRMMADVGSGVNSEQPSSSKALLPSITNHPGKQTALSKPEIAQIASKHPPPKNSSITSRSSPAPVVSAKHKNGCSSRANNDRLMAVLDSALDGGAHTTSTSHKGKHKLKRSTKHGKDQAKAASKGQPSVQQPQSSESDGIPPLLRFKKFAYQIKNQIMWKKGLERAEQHLKTVVPTSFDSHTETLTFNVNAFKPEIQSYGGLSLRAKAILMQPSFTRSEEELKFIHQFTIRLKCFDRYPVYVRKELARVLYYEAFEKERVVIRQGDIGFNFYFILSGSVLVEMQEEDQKTGKKHNMIIGELGAGAAFGELALLHDDHRRATIVCNENCEFLKIDKPDFDEVLKKNYEREWNTRMHHLQNHPLFQTWSLSSLHYAVEGSTITEYPSESLILKDLSVPSDKVYFIVKGACNVVQKVYLLENVENNTHVQLTTKHPKEKLFLPPIQGAETATESKGNLTLQQPLTQQYQSRYGPVNFGVNRRVKRWWIVHTLQPGDYFGVGEGREGMSVISNQKVELLQVNKMVFKKHDRGKMLAAMREESGHFYPTQQAALKSYIITRKWSEYKRKLVSEAVEGKRTQSIY